MTEKQKIIVVLGPTASGKSNLAVEIALAFNGEVISADSRQVYKGLDIGTGKITPEEMKGVPHHLLDIASPKDVFTVQDFKTLAEKAIKEILQKNKVPVICGGTGFYIQMLVDNITLPDVQPNADLREKLAQKTTEKLFEMLGALDPDRAETIDRHNPVRLIRAIEIAEALGRVPKVQSNPQYDALQIGIETNDAELKDRIYKRLISRLEKGMVEEAESLHAEGLSWDRMEALGLEYRYLARFLQNKITKTELIEQLGIEIWHYAKRQRTWFKRDKRIRWLALTDKEKIKQAVAGFLTHQG